MSRVGKNPIPVPSGVTVTIGAGTVTVSGPKGELRQELPGVITVRQVGDELLVDRPDDLRENRAQHGLVRALVSNMVVGVTEGWRRDLEIVGVGYRAIAKGADTLEMQLGYSHLIEVVAPEGIQFEVPVPTRVSVLGIDKQVVGQVAANIRALRKPEPYKGKGVRYSNEVVRRKAGKAGA